MEIKSIITKKRCNFTSLMGFKHTLHSRMKAEDDHKTGIVPISIRLGAINCESCVCVLEQVDKCKFLQHSRISIRFLFHQAHIIRVKFSVAAL